MIYIRNIFPTKSVTNTNAMEKLTTEILPQNSKTLTVSNWHLQLENSHYLQRTGILLSELHPNTKIHEVTFADVNAHDTAWDQTANPNARGEYLVNAVMDENSTFLNDPEQTTR